MLGIRIGTFCGRKAGVRWVGADAGSWVPDLSMARWEAPAVQLPVPVPVPVPMPMPEGGQTGAAGVLLAALGGVSFN